MKLSLVIIMLASMAFAGKSPKFNNGKMKADEVFKKCGEWARKDTESIKDEKERQKSFLKSAHSCSLNNGFDAKGDEGNEMWIKYGRR